MSERSQVDSLLTLLQTEHLDPGYAAAARAPQTRRLPTVWLAVAGVFVGTVLGVGGAQAASRAPDTNVVRAGLYLPVDEVADRGPEVGVVLVELPGRLGRSHAGVLPCVGVNRR